MVEKLGHGSPYTVRSIRALRGGKSDASDVATMKDYRTAIKAAEQLAADFYDDDDFAVSVFVIDRYGAAIHQAKGEPEDDRSAHAHRRARVA